MRRPACARGRPTLLFLQLPPPLLARLLSQAFEPQPPAAFAKPTAGDSARQQPLHWTGPPPLGLVEGLPCDGRTRGRRLSRTRSERRQGAKADALPAPNNCARSSTADARTQPIPLHDPASARHARTHTRRLPLMGAMVWGGGGLLCGNGGVVRHRFRGGAISTSPCPYLDQPLAGPARAAVAIAARAAPPRRASASCAAGCGVVWWPAPAPLLAGRGAVLFSSLSLLLLGCAVKQGASRSCSISAAVLCSAAAAALSPP